MVVNDIHDDPDPRIVQTLDHFLHFQDANFRLIGIGRVGSFRNIEVLRIIAPVVLFQGFQLVDCGKIGHRQKLDMRNAQFFQVIQPCLVAIRR
ncbi:hypothetical protein SDC9_83940 [bioreactor metagenome]|uniref:Uncharacterized protein n=1 Tax=bioreactor metagenome TaxID=1076179 RepID=A0A644Z8W5_9ZZZZ